MRVIATATLSDWFRNLAPVFQRMRGKTKFQPIAPYTRDVFRTFKVIAGKSQVIAGNSWGKFCKHNGME